MKILIYESYKISINYKRIIHCLEKQYFIQLYYILIGNKLKITFKVFDLIYCFID